MIQCLTIPDSLIYPPASLLCTSLQFIYFMYFSKLCPSLPFTSLFIKLDSVFIFFTIFIHKINIQNFPIHTGYRVAKSVKIGKHCTALHYTSNTTLHGLFPVYKFANFLSKIRFKNGWIASFFRKFLILKFRPYKYEPTDFLLITNLTWNWFHPRKFSRKIQEHQKSCNLVYFSV